MSFGVGKCVLLINPLGRLAPVALSSVAPWRSSDREVEFGLR
jgi:hypothetical protein